MADCLCAFSKSLGGGGGGGNACGCEYPALSVWGLRWRAAVIKAAAGSSCALTAAQCASWHCSAHSVSCCRRRRHGATGTEYSTILYGLVRILMYLLLLSVTSLGFMMRFVFFDSLIEKRVWPLKWVHQSWYFLFKTEFQELDACTSLHLHPRGKKCISCTP